MNDSTADAGTARQYAFAERSDSMESDRHARTVEPTSGCDDRESPEVIKLMAYHAPLSF